MFPQTTTGWFFFRTFFKLWRAGRWCTFKTQQNICKISSGCDIKQILGSTRRLYFMKSFATIPTIVFRELRCFSRFWRNISTGLTLSTGNLGAHKGSGGAEDGGMSYTGANNSIWLPILRCFAHPPGSITVALISRLLLTVKRHARIIILHTVLFQRCWFMADPINDKLYIPFLIVFDLRMQQKENQTSGIVGYIQRLAGPM